MLLLPRPTTPDWQRHQALPPARFRLFPFRSPLLRESLLLFFPRGTQMFQFPRFPPLVLCVHTRVTPHDGCGVSPFGHPRIEARSAAPRGFSQPPTSFIGIRRQGIHRWLFIAWKSKRCSCSLSNSQGAGASQPARAGARRELEDDDTLPGRPRRGPREGGAFPQNGTEEDRPTSAGHGEAREPANGGRCWKVE